MERQHVMAKQVSLKRQQAQEDQIAIGLRARVTGRPYGYLPPGPVFCGEETRAVAGLTEPAAGTAVRDGDQGGAGTGSGKRMSAELDGETCSVVMANSGKDERKFFFLKKLSKVLFSPCLFLEQQKNREKILKN